MGISWRVGSACTFTESMLSNICNCVEVYDQTCSAIIYFVQMSVSILLARRKEQFHLETFVVPPIRRQISLIKHPLKSQINDGFVMREPSQDRRRRSRHVIWSMRTARTSPAQRVRRLLSPCSTRLKSNVGWTVSYGKAGVSPRHLYNRYPTLPSCEPPPYFLPRRT
jgi:hypothetical protein